MSAADGYELVRHLGMGLGSAVYLAETSSGHIAIRQFVSQSEVGSAAWREEREHFLKSGRQALSLKHPNIVPVLEVIDEGGEAFVSMEYESAPTLESELANKEFGLPQANSVLRQVSRALDFAHSQGVVHGDLKPSDIFLLPDSTVRVSGFAISPRARQDPRRPMGANFLHPYLTPEHMAVPMVLEPRSDQYALGIMAYRLYTGALPYADNADLRPAILTAAIAPPSTVRPKLHRGADAPILRALDRDPLHRFASCSDFVSGLEAAVMTADTSQRRRLSSILYAALAALALLIAYFVWSDSKVPVSESGGQNPVAKREKTPDALPVQTPQSPPAATQPVQSQQIARAQSTTPSNPEAKPAAKSRQTDANVTPHDGPKPPKSENGLVAQSRPSRRNDGPSETVSSRNSETDTSASEPAATRSAILPAHDFSIDVYSRNTPLSDGISFASGDPTLGELAQGDLKAMVQYDGVRQSRNKLVLEWSIDQHPMDKKAVQPNQLVEYGNEPTPGYYRIKLLVDGREAKTFSFRITP